MHAFEQPQVLRRQRQLPALTVQAVNARKQGRVHVERVLVRRQARRHGALHCLQGRAGFAVGEVAEQQLDAVVEPTTLIQCCHRVGESRALGMVGDGVELGALRSHGDLERALEILGPDAIKRRQAVGGEPVGQQGIVRGLGGGVGYVHELIVTQLPPARSALESTSLR